MPQPILPDQVGRECVMFRVRLTARAVTKHYEDALRPCGLKGPQFSLLVSLSADPGLSATELAHRMGIDRTTLVRNLDLLERDGLIATSLDGRARRKTLTRKGAGVLAEALPLWRAAQDALIGKLGAPAWADTRKKLRALREAV